MYISYQEYPIGKIGIVEKDGFIIAVALEKELNKYDFIEATTPLLNKAHQQLGEYFQGKRKKFDLPLNPQGTNFQKKCWKALETIPYGSVYTYKQLATAIGNEKASRAVGNANNKNPILIMIPCHRVIGSSGQLVGYRGGLEMKEYLLAHEKNHS